MSLDAFVFCDCFERGRLRQPPPPGSHPHLEADGFLDSGSEDLEVQIAFDVWRYNQACEHEGGMLIHHRIGNIGLVAALRQELRQYADQLPLILSKVIYDGVHGGDYIPIDELRKLRSEVLNLARIHSADPDMESWLRTFETQMAELVDCALEVGKPITF
jgi:hypothetical protein